MNSFEVKQDVYNPLSIANYFVQKSFATGKELTPMKVVKLVYISHGWYLALADKALINEPIQAWKYGPVIKSVYQEFKEYGKDQITGLATIFTSEGFVTPSIADTDNDLKKFLDRVWELYGNFSGVQLSSLTHKSDTPWDKVWNQQKLQSPNQIIGNDLIKDHYKKMIKQTVASVQ